jgi:hypothetical protein
MDGFNTKQKGDIAEYRVIAELLRRGLNVLKPLGDRLPYDLAIERDGKLLRVQVKMAWKDPTGNFVVDIRRSQTNRTVYKHTKYQEDDFDFLVAWIPDNEVFYIFPASFACSFGSSITMVEGPRRQRPPRSAPYRNRWDLFEAHVTVEQPGSLSAS